MCTCGAERNVGRAGRSTGARKLIHDAVPSAERALQEILGGKGKQGKNKKEGATARLKSAAALWIKTGLDLEQEL